ncbi:KaiC domain-containing protein [Salinigranum sp.]|uniref:KaiC domain-containing protein n=1 Tax=Salinigranum sp. TaxID=1966351 RepID=UPI0035669561
MTGDGDDGEAGDGDDDWFERALEETEGDQADADEEDADEEDAARDDAERRDTAGAGAQREDGDGADRGDVFGTDFASAFEDAPTVEGSDTPDSAASGPSLDAPDIFGGTDDGFDESEFESNLERIDVGIEGLDEMILGGVPKRSMMVAIGAAGTGKTTFGLQFLEEALSTDGRAVYITLEESRERILDTAEEKGWPFRDHVEEERLVVVDLDPVEMANSLASIRGELPRLIDEFGADRLVLDSVSLLEMMYDHPARRRSEVFDFARSLKEGGVTTMLTSEVSEDNPYTSRYGIVEYLADAVFVLQYIRSADTRETRLGVEIQKIRDANHSRETKPYEITNDGISVYRQANIF